MIAVGALGLAERATGREEPTWLTVQLLERTPTRRLTTTKDVTDAAVFLLENPSVNGVNLAVDGGWIMV